MSFKQEVFLDLRASILKQHPSHLLHPAPVFLDSKNGILKTTAIYGANASGKSNLISAFYSMRSFILSQLYMNIHADDEPFVLEPFFLCNKLDTTEFEIVFRYKNHRYQYGFEISISNEEKASDSILQKIVAEWYDIDGEVVFERNDKKIKFGTKYAGSLKDYRKIPSDRIYISVLDYFLDDDTKKNIIGDFISYFRNHFNVYSAPVFEFSVKRMGVFASVSDRLIEDESFRRKVVSYLQQIDVGINDLIVVEDKRRMVNSKGEPRKKINTSHTIYSQTGESCGTALFDLTEESSGTLRFLGYIQRIIEILEDGGVFIVDELSDKLHPLLTKFIIDLFQSEENKAAQLIFTTHDIFQLTKEQFRRDEIVFIEKNSKGESSISSLANLKVREDATFNKDYINGKYGAIPIIRNILEGDQ